MINNRVTHLVVYNILCVFISKWHPPPRMIILTHLGLSKKKKKSLLLWMRYQFEKNEIDDCGAHGWSVSRYKTWSEDNGA